MDFLKKFFGRFFVKEEPEWDDGTGKPPENKKEEAVVSADVVMVIYGALAGFIGWQLVEYLHQRFACAAWGYEFTSQPIESYGVVQVVMDFMFFLLVYAFMCAIGLFVDWLTGRLLGKKVKKGAQRTIMSNSLMYGFLAMVVLSIIMWLVPFNMFLIGVP